MTRARRPAGAKTPASSPSHPATSADAPRAPEPRPGRFRARLPLLPALALLLGALSLFHAAPAAAQALAATNLQVTAGDGSLTVTWDATSYTPTSASVRWRVKDTDPNTAGNQPGPWPHNLGISVPTAQFNARRAVIPPTGCAPQQTFCAPLTNGVTYEVEVRLTASGGRTDWLSVDGTPVAPVIPAAPTNLSVSAGDAQLGLTWTAPMGTVTGYDVHYTSSTTVAADAAAVSSVSAGWVAHTRSSTLTTATHSVTPLTNGTPYRVRVRAKNAAGAGPWLGHEGTFTPAKPTITSFVVTPGDSKLDVSWTLPTGVTSTISLSFAYTRSTTVALDAVVGTDPASSWAGVLLPASTTSHSLTGLDNGTTYRVRLRATVLVGAVPELTDYVEATGRPSAQQATSTDADLTALSVSSATASDGTFTDLTLSPVFDSDTTEYTASVANAQTHAKLAWTLSDSNASVKVGKGTSLTTTTAAVSGAIELAEGANALKVEVTAEAGGTMATYTVTVTRAALQTGTIALSATPNPVDEGDSVTVTVTLGGSAPAADVVVPVTLTAGTAETGDYGALASITVSAGQTTGTGTITTTVDTDGDDETFTVALGTLPTGYAAGLRDALNPLKILINDLSELSLEIKYGDQRLYVGPDGDLGDPADTHITRYVVASPTMEHLDLKLSWPAGAIASDPTAQVYYYMPGVAGDTLTWSTGQNGTTKTLEMYSYLGTPGYPKVTLSAGAGIEYTIIFQNNGAWEFHHNNLLDRLEMTIPQGP